MFVSIMAFFARVSDPAVGGTYMTLLNTLTNLGGNWPSTLALWMVDPLTSKQCVPGANMTETASLPRDNTCLDQAQVDACTGAGGACHTCSGSHGGLMLSPQILVTLTTCGVKMV